MAVITQGTEKLFLFFDPSSVFVVIGGTVSAMLVGYPLLSLLTIQKPILITFTARERDPLQMIDQIVSLSEAARREGLLSLENHLEEVDNPFLETGILMAVDGMAPEVVENIMNTEIDAVNNRHGYGKQMMSDLGKYCPAFGMIGTLIGLVLMLADMDPDTIGAGMAVAILTTLYGAVLSNLVFLPWADKLGFINDQEMLVMEITLKGVIAIQSGENPRIIKQKLLMYIPPAKRPIADDEA